MVGVFSRSLSFPNKIPSRPSPKPRISRHIRSISLPCRSHPLISQIKDDIIRLTSWSSTSKLHPQTTTNLCHSLSLLAQLHSTLQDIFQLPHTQESLRRQPRWVEHLLEDFLLFVDVHGIFQSSVLALKEQHSAAQMAVRKRDHSKVILYVRARKRMAREMEKLASKIRCVEHNYGVTTTTTLVPVGDAELAGVIVDVIRVTACVSVALFSGIGSSLASRKLSWGQLVKLSRKGRSERSEQEGIKELRVESLCSLKKKGDEEVRSALKRMRDLEGSISLIETVSDRVFRALINSQVALLNTRAH
ncbi:uncharacterized protein LOC114724363 [Neltuma alba]|uniref:uncharacterized protein LOC114724363 n=1 Tax=Neltuma alba TaxID=207710 RepID=UPI0010A2C447|nr:uncharacterized protein LOC114724363 [Prosopis alba]